MTATNHGLMGVVIGAYLPIPIALPVAFASHFILDALPHYGIPHNQRNRSRSYKTVVAIDTLVALSFALLGAYLGQWAMFWVGWVSYSPDLMWVIDYFKHKHNLHIKPKNPLSRFHKNIQRFERPWGAYVELVVFVVLVSVSLNALLST